jgi:fucose 4-O-acetylase-like acetyltransferase
MPAQTAVVCALGRTSLEERNQLADALKGAAILLVVLGHAIQTHVVHFQTNLVFCIIYSFHMPLFIAVSGWLAVPDRFTLLKHTRRLILPMFVWYAVEYVAKGRFRTTSVPGYLMDWVKSPDWGLWFLWILFLCQVGLYACFLLERRIGAAAYVGGAVVLYLAPVQILGFPLYRYYFPYFVAAFILHRNWSVMGRFTRVSLYLSILAFAPAISLWNFSPTAGESHLLYMLCRVIAAVTGSIAFSWLVSALKPLHKGLAWLGRRTMEIYTSHGLFIELLPGIALSSLFSLGSSLAVASLLRLSPILATVFYGASSRKAGTALRPDPSWA